MIVTLTPNPSVDRTITIDSLVRGAVHRAVDYREDPGGKGINVSRALALHDIPTIAVLPVGGHSGRLMLDLMDETGVQTHPVPIPGAVRANVALIEPDGTTTKINEAGPTLSDADAQALIDGVRESAVPGGWVVGCGSLPPGLPHDFLAWLCTLAGEWGAHVAIDSSGVPMERALSAAPDLIKPNRVELADAIGRELPTLGAVINAGRELVDRGIASVLVSLGRDGAALVTADGAWHAQASGIIPVSTVGAGDSLLAGYLAATFRGLPTADALAMAVGFGAAAVALPGSIMPSPSDLAAVRVTVSESLNESLPLSD